MARIETPATIEEACELLAASRGDARVLGGGTALQMFRRRGEFDAGTLVDLRRIPGIDAIEATGDGVSIGALATHRRVELDPGVAEVAPVLCTVESQIANVRVRNAATIGGNLAHADHRLDPPGALLIHGATLEVASPAGTRTMPVGELFTGFGEKALGPDEILVRIRVPRTPDGARTAFRKYKSLGANDWPCAAVAGLLHADGDGPDRLELGLTAVAPTPQHLVLDVAGLGLEEALERADAAVNEAIAPVTDLRGSAEFKRRVVRVIAKDTIRQLWEEETAR